MLLEPIPHPHPQLPLPPTPPHLLSIIVWCATVMLCKMIKHCAKHKAKVLMQEFKVFINLN